MSFTVTGKSCELWLWSWWLRALTFFKRTGVKSCARQHSEGVKAAVKNV